MPNDQWTTRVWREFRARNLTRSYRDVLLTLRTFRGAGGRCVPAHTTLADRAACCVRTVQSALQRAQQLDLVSWTERRVRGGWRWLRTSNAYTFNMPRSAVQPGLRRPLRRHATTGQDVRGGERKTLESKKTALEALLREAAAAPNLLAIRRAVIEQRMLAARAN